MCNFAAVNLKKQKNEENEQQYLVVAQLEIQIIAGFVVIPISKIYERLIAHAVSLFF